jgi:acetyl esterase/lipase
MQTHNPTDAIMATPWLTVHPLGANDAATIAAMRKIIEPRKGLLQGTAARPTFNEIMGHVPAPAKVSYSQDTVKGVPGWWCRPSKITSEGIILYLHGGWYIWGSAQAYCHLAGHLAARTGAAVFVADYRLAPEHVFPSAIQDAQACYQGLLDRGLKQIVLAGDSAGGGLALVLASLLSAVSSSVQPVSVVALSPLTDLALTGQSWQTRAAADPYFTLNQAVGLVQLYLGDHSPKDPLASPLYGDLKGLPPIRIHVGEDELLLDDSVRYVARAVAADVEARLDIWQGLPHVFPSNVGSLAAADEALNAIGQFLAERLAVTGL